jgi:hypothetical protein
MELKAKKYISSFMQLVILAVLSVSCVESLSDSTTSAVPSISVTSPKTNDSVRVGYDTVSYTAAEGSGGSGLSFYEVYVNKTFVKKFTQNTDGTNPVIYLPIDSALLHTKISYSVKVYNSSGNSKESTTQTNLYVKDKAPSAPSDLLLAKLSDYAVTLKWTDNSSNETGFEIWRRDVGNSSVVEYRKWKTLGVNTISYTDAGLSPYVDYTYKVRTYGEGGYSAFCTAASTSSLPGGPWSLQAEAITNSSVHLKWIDFATNEQGFQIERSDGSSSTFKVLALVAPNTTEYYDNSVSTSTAYTYRICYFTLTTQSSYSNTATVSTYYTTVDAPTITYYDNTGLIKWHDNSHTLAKSTIIERKVGLNGDYVEYATVAADSTVTDYSYTDPPTGVVYYYRLRQSLGSKVYTPYTKEIHIPF